MAEVGIANSLILLSRGVNQATRKRCFVGAGARRGNLLRICIFMVRTYLPVVKTFTLGSLYYSWLLRKLRIQDFVVSMRISLSRPRSYYRANKAKAFRKLFFLFLH